jgi:hypothetical protein
MTNNEMGEAPENLMGFQKIMLQLLESLKSMAMALQMAAERENLSNCFHGAKIQNLVIHGNMYLSSDSNHRDAVDDEVKDKVASKEMMSRAAKVTLDGGYWKSQRSWSVIFIVYCIWGYKGCVSDFLKEVPGWPDKVDQRMICNRDAVEKLKNTYYFSKNIKEWRGNGIPEQYCILGEQLDAELEKMMLMPVVAE